MINNQIQEEKNGAIYKLPILVPLVAIVAMFMIPVTYKQYSLYSEIHDFSYQALSNNIDRYPDDVTFLLQIRESMDDGKISGKEHKEIVDRLLEINGSYRGAAIDTDHSHAKQLLIDKIEPPRGIAKNISLKENIFIMYCSILNRIPLFLTGKPGCSKTLSINIIIDALRG